MNDALIAIAAVLLLLLAVALLRKRQLARAAELKAAQDEVQKTKQELSDLARKSEGDILRVRQEAEAAVVQAQRLVDQQIADVAQEAERAKRHLEEEAQQLEGSAREALSSALAQVASLQRYQGLADAEGEANRLVAEALSEVAVLRIEARSMLDLARAAGVEERSQASQRAKDIRDQADALLDHATREAGRIIEEAHKKAQDIAGDAYTALRDKEQLERAVVAIKNVVEGYGDRYVVPTRSLLDDLAAEFGHTQAGHALAAAREQTKRMVEEGHAAECD
jgi:hypothetical protein